MSNGSKTVPPFLTGFPPLGSRRKSAGQYTSLPLFSPLFFSVCDFVFQNSPSVSHNARSALEGLKQLIERKKGRVDERGEEAR